MHNVKPYATRESRALTLGGLFAKKKAELQTFLKLIATLQKQGKISGFCLGDSVIATMSCPENTCMYRKSRHSQFR